MFTDIVKTVTLFVILIAIVAVTFVGCNNLIQETAEQKAITETISAISAGTIVDKQIAESYATAFRESSIRFLIIVSGEVEYDDELHTAEKTFAVTEDIYNRYSVGDWFDSKNLTSEQQFANGE
ncbi:MAG: hypothetical protein NC452_05795 [Eubacterium sp.]|nr:hypothetical protein [Eubacterium sp.]